MSAKPLKPSLTALGTAAVLGIYAAGYAATQEAAERMEGGFSTSRSLADSASISAQAVFDSLAAEAADSGALVIAASETDTEVGAATPSATPAGAAASGPPQPDPSPAAAPSSGSPAAAAPPAPGSAPASAPATPSSTAAAPAPAPAPESPYLDGEYLAWGIRTRHGDIQVRMQITGGRIVSVAINECGMAWPCSDVNPLITRVLSAQRPNIALISGATQSSEAFTTAVRDALILARQAKEAQNGGQPQ